MPIFGGTLGVVTRERTQTDITLVEAGGISLDFSISFGTSFILTHGLESSNLVWQMWITSTSPNRQVIPDDVILLDDNHVQIELQTPMDGMIKLVRI